MEEKPILVTTKNCSVEYTDGMKKYNDQIAIDFFHKPKLPRPRWYQYPNPWFWKRRKETAKRMQEQREQAERMFKEWMQDKIDEAMFKSLSDLSSSQSPFVE